MAASNLQPRSLPLDPKYDDYDFPTDTEAPANGHPGWTTQQQDAQVSQLRMMLEAKGYTKRLDTITLLRFLRARKFDVALSEEMFVDRENWRKDERLDDLVPIWDYKEKAAMFEYYPQYYHKTDKDGRPVYIEQMGKIDLASMSKITTDKRMILNLAVEYEKVADPRLPACSRKSGYLLETCCTIMDMKGVGISKFPYVYSYVAKTSEISQNYYPERLGKMYLINAPWGFSTVWNVIKAWLDPVTVAKIHILGSDYATALLAQVPAENLPTAFGGTCECKGGCQFSDDGPWQDPEFAKPAKWQKGAKEQKPDIIDTTATNPGTILDAGASGAAPPASHLPVNTGDEIKPAPAVQ